MIKRSKLRPNPVADRVLWVPVPVSALIPVNNPPYCPEYRHVSEDPARDHLISYRLRFTPERSRLKNALKVRLILKNYGIAAKRHERKEIARTERKWDCTKNKHPPE